MGKLIGSFTGPVGHAPHAPKQFNGITVAPVNVKTLFVKPKLEMVQGVPDSRISGPELLFTKNLYSIVPGGNGIVKSQILSLLESSIGLQIPHQLLNVPFKNIAPTGLMV
jgi:hypothetical protein